MAMTAHRIIVLLTCILSSGASQECAEGSCTCDYRRELCETSKSVYDDGGTAVSFQPLSESNATVCSRPTSYRVANWMGRRATWTSSPRVTLNVNLVGCQWNAESCCCNEIQGNVHVWQTLPDGTYPSLKVSDSTECRGYQEGSASFSFDTLAPGSVGAMGGLGPGGWDIAPYIGPVIHLLAEAQGHSPVLIDVPIHPNPTTLRPSRFVGPNLHGSSWVRNKSSPRYDVADWISIPDENRIELTVNVHLVGSTTKTGGLESHLCPSLVYGFPTSFFTEPIGLCAPVLLNFLTL